MENQIERDCPVCGKSYHADPARLKFGRQTTCSRACSYELRAANKENRQEYKCPVCGKLFHRTPAQVKARHGNTCCSMGCAYKVRQRVVTKPYVLVSEHDRQEAGKKAWRTRRANPKPYPDSARKKARAQAVEQIKNGHRVSKFERKVAEVFRAMGFHVVPGYIVRRANGTFACVFDLFVPSRNMVIECHGTYWHGGRWTWDNPSATQEKNLRYESRKVVMARHIGLDLRILWEHEFKQDPAGACLAVAR